MDRRNFTRNIVRVGLITGLAGITILLSRKVVFKKDCKSCPEYADCPGLTSCAVEDQTLNNE